MRPAIFDIDIGSDPDDSFVAVMVARAPARFRPILMLTNDEASRHGRARFLAHLMAGTGIPVAAGLPSQRLRETVLTDWLGLPRSDDFDPDGGAALERALEAHPEVDYFGLGALDQPGRAPAPASRARAAHPPAPDGPRAGPRPRPRDRAVQRADRPAWASVTRWPGWPAPAWSSPTSAGRRTRRAAARSSASTWAGRWPRRCATGGRWQWLLAAHLEGWVASGKSCSILHDPLTVLAQHLPLIDWEDGELVLDDEGFADRPPGSRPGMTGPPLEVRLSVRADYAAARRAIVEALLDNLDAEALAAAWRHYDERT